MWATLGSMFHSRVLSAVAVAAVATICLSSNGSSCSSRFHSKGKGNQLEIKIAFLSGTKLLSCIV